MAIWNDSDHCKHDMPWYNCVLCAEQEKDMWRKRALKAEKELEEHKLVLKELSGADVFRAFEKVRNELQ